MNWTRNGIRYKILFTDGVVWLESPRGSVFWYYKQLGNSANITNDKVIQLWWLGIKRDREQSSIQKL